MDNQSDKKLLKGIAYLCFIPYAEKDSPPLEDNEKKSENENNDDDINQQQQQQQQNYYYHWFQGIFISLPNKKSYGLMGDTVESPPLPHPCCYPDKTCPPQFYNVTLLDYDTHRKTFIKYILQSGGDNISLTTHWEPDNFILDDKMQKIQKDNPHFEFHTLTVKYNEEAVHWMENYFPKLKPDSSCIICIGNLEVELKR